MKRLVSVFALAGALAACDPGPGTPEAEATAAVEATPAVATPDPSPTGNGARAVADETDDFVFEYSYPAEAGRVPELATLLDIWLERRRSELASESAAARRQAREDGFPYNKHSYTAEWKLISNLPQWISMSVDIATYSGGAHGNYRTESLVWDKRQEQAMDAMELFTSPAALGEALGDRYCDALDREREKRRQTKIEEGSQEMFDQCPGMDELEVLLGSSNGRTFNRLTVYAGPYVAGPYAEGAYEVDLRVDDAVLDVVKPEYREAFVARN